MSMDWMGYAGTGLVIVAYLPQVKHLFRERCSVGVSSSAYLIWGIASMLLLTYAVAKRDPVFIGLQIYQLSATAIISLLSWRYRASVCEMHGSSIGSDS